MIATLQKKNLIIVKKHLGEQVSCLYQKDVHLWLLKGELDSVDYEKITLKPESEGKTHAVVPFIQNHEQCIYHIYNRYNIDIYNARQTPTMGKLFRIRQLQDEIISLMKQYVGKELYFVYKHQDKINMILGKFQNLAINGVSALPAPFYNREVILGYYSVIHIYTKDFCDLIDF